MNLWTHEQCSYVGIVMGDKVEYFHDNFRFALSLSICNIATQFHNDVFAENLSKQTQKRRKSK